jgi:hypothetical protein
MDQLKMIGIVTFSILVLIALFVGTIWYSRLPI